MELETIRVETRKPATWIRLNRPKAMNALSPQLIEELGETIGRLEQDETVRALVITGAPPAFCAGADLKFVLEASSGADKTRMVKFTERIGEVFGRLTRFPQPVIAAVNGLALAGGLELVMCCDIVIAAESAKLGDAHSNYGLIPGGGGAVRLPKRIGAARAKYLLYTGDFIPASEFLAAGLVNQVVPDAELEGAAQALVEKLAQRSPVGLRRIKRLVADSLEQPDDSALRLERIALEAHLHSEDALEGLRAFREKRKPQFPGR